MEAAPSETPRNVRRSKLVIFRPDGRYMAARRDYLNRRAVPGRAKILFVNIMLRRFFNSTGRKAEAPRPRVPADKRVYAIGDVHGCDAQFAELLSKIDADHAARSPKDQLIILLGDLV